MTIADLTKNHTPIITEGSVVDRLKREAADHFDPHLGYCGLAFKDHGIVALNTVYGEYLNIGNKYKLTTLIASPTWKVGRDVQELSDLKQPMREAAEVMLEIKSLHEKQGMEVFVSGRVGPKNDCYLPEEALSAEQAYEFHSLQIEQLAENNFDLLDACTLPALSEALGIAKSMSTTDLPYNLSFVIRADGKVLDGNLLSDVIYEIDSKTDNPPLFYMINCVHPQTAYKALEELVNYSPDILKRIRGFQGNTSPRDPIEFSALTELEGINPSEFASATIKLYHDFGIHILGGCCGTNTKHIEALAVEFRV
jgi:S-methylmethionine-dependent homocysteine/selenocysteine methylase